MSSESANDRVAVDSAHSSVGEATSEDSANHLFTSTIREFPWPVATLAGGLTFVVEYLIVATIVVAHPALSTGADTLLEQLKTYGLILFNAHAVPAVRVPEGIALRGPRRFNLVADATTIPPLVYFAIPVVSLLLAGVLFEWFRRQSDEGVLEGATMVGTGLVAGYAVVGTLASFAVVTTTLYHPGSVTEGVDQVFAFAAMIGYPLVVGSIGALAVRAYRTHVA